ncbi:DUF4145 domain-containing protein [Salmonella enterica]|nr:hypothetical protein [Salmonella enterica subsp. enterica serovar Montevideo]EDG4308539.1 DUF4145 domain-containing protein [Salmonella enterica]EDQ1913953.1 DUF4145 domain-containing protein [Salmonella enterica subsp. enterica]EDH5347831.1 hypothetical protein [Salmonella enterica subsp. enterica serovar Montevideo]EDI8931926.1 hypothetical protein [Salmonella enterica]
MSHLHTFNNVKCSACESNASFSLLMCRPLRELQHDHYRNMETWSDSRDHFRGLFTCNNCHNPVCIEFHFKADYSENPDLKDMMSSTVAFLNRLRPIDINNARSFIIDVENMGIALNPYFVISRIYPDGRISIPGNLPGNIHSLFTDDLIQTTSPRLIVVACRSIIEAACRDKLSEKELHNKSLVRMIDMLIEHGELGNVIGSWAHTVRQLGNEVVHRFDSPSPDLSEAKEVLDLTTTLLELLYTYPAKIKAMQKKNND